MSLVISPHARQWSASENDKIANGEITGLMVILYGNGKGKSTSAFGMAHRALQHGKRVGVVKFLSGPDQSADTLALVNHAICDVMEVGAHCSWDRTRRQRDKAEIAAGWLEAKRMLNDPAYHLVVLDDLSWVIQLGYLDSHPVSEELRARRQDLHIVITGQKMPLEWIDMADMVTEMQAVKHPYPGTATPPQAGIDF